LVDVRRVMCLAGVWGGVEDVVGKTEDDYQWDLVNRQSTRRAHYGGE